MKTFNQFINEAVIKPGMKARSKDGEGDLAGKEFTFLKVNDDEVEVKFTDGTTAVAKLKDLNIDPGSIRRV